MPYKIRKGGGKKPYKITKKSGKQVGSSTSKGKAQASVRERHMGKKRR